MAFEAYATGKYSYRDIANLLNDAGFRTTKGRPFSQEGVKDLLRNPLYISQLRHQESRYGANGERRYDNPIEVSKGQDEAIMPLDLWEKVQTMRVHRYHKKHGEDAHHGYLLQGLVYCWPCFNRHQQAKGKMAYSGKCHCHAKRGPDGKGLYKRYRCVAGRNGYVCAQQSALVEAIDQQVLDVLFSLKVPTDRRKCLVTSIASEMLDDSLESRLNEIKHIISRMDYRFDYEL